MILFIFFATCSCVGGAYPEHGLSMNLQSDKTYSDQRWVAVEGWTYDRNNPGQFYRGLKVDEAKTNIVMQKSGIYYVSFHLTLATQRRGYDVAVAGVINNDTVNRFPLYSSVAAKCRTSLSASGFLKLKPFDELSVNIYCNDLCHIYKNSILSIHYQVNTFAATGFSFSLPKSISVLNTTSPHSIGQWKPNAYGQFSSSSLFDQGQASFQIPYSGVYKVTTNLIFIKVINSGYIEVLIYADDVKMASSFTSLATTSTVTVNINENIFLNSGSRIEIKVFHDAKVVEVSDLSTFSLLLIKSHRSLGDGFRANLLNGYTAPSSNHYQELYPWIVPVNVSASFKNLSASYLVDDKNFNTGDQVTSIFYATCQLVFSVILNDTSPKNTDLLTVSFHKDSNSIYAEKSVEVCSDNVFTTDPTVMSANSNSSDNKNESISQTTSNMTYVVNLEGLFELSHFDPLSIAFRSNAVKPIKFEKESSFSTVETVSNYPGVHGSLQGLSRRIFTGEEIVIKGWRYSGQRGLYSFTGDQNSNEGSFVATFPGVYFIGANIITEDVDNTNRLKAKLSSNQGSTVVHSTEGNPLQQTTMNLGGLFSLKRNEIISLYVQAKDDEEWKIITGGFSATYIGLMPSYIQVLTGKDQIVRKEMKTIIEYPDSGFLKNNSFKIRSSGIYFTTANVIIDTSGAPYNQQTMYKVYLTIDGKEIQGLYSKRRTISISIDHMTTLFLSGSFYATAGAEVAMYIETDVTHSFLVSEFSSWGIIFVADAALSAGALATLYQVPVFGSESSSPYVGDWKYTSSLAGSYELLSESLYFEEKAISVLQDGIYIISLNLEIGYSIRSEPTVFQVSITVNDVEFTLSTTNGMSTSEKSYWPVQTLHVCGTMFLQANDRVSIQINSRHLNKVTIMKPSGLSIVLIPEADLSPSFAVQLKKNFTLYTGNQPSLEWEFSGELSSKSFNLNNGHASISNDGYYILSLYLPVIKHMQANQLIANVTLNRAQFLTHTLDLSLKNGAVYINEIVYLKSEDILNVNLFVDLLPECNRSYVIDSSSNTSGSNSSECRKVLTIKREGSVFSLLFVPNLKSSHDWLARFAEDASFNDVNKLAPLFPWDDPIDKSGIYNVKDNGVHLCVSKISVRNIIGTVEIVFQTKDQLICSVILNCKSACNHLFHINCIANLTKSDLVGMSLKVSQPATIVEKNSSRTLSLLSSDPVGFHLSFVQMVELPARSRGWVALGIWSVNASTYGLFMNEVIMYLNELIFLQSGTYLISANIPVKLHSDRRGNICSTSCFIHCGIFINDELESTVYKSVEVSNNLGAITIDLFGGISLKKWDKVSIKIKSQMDSGLSVLEGSTWSALLIAPAPFSQLANPGPVMMSELNPANISTYITGVKRLWYCQAFGDGDLTYKWYKNGEVYLIQEAKEGILILNGSVNDTATYHCGASLNGIEVTSNKVIVDIYDIDECNESMHNCADNASCRNEVGSYSCICNPGFVGNGEICEDMDECKSGNYSCGINTECVNVVGSYKCSCKNGYTGEGGVCDDVDECTTKSDNCNASVGICFNTNGSFYCACTDGWIGDGIDCQDIDECKNGTFQCNIDASCENLIGGYKCNCNKGFSGDGKTCSDVDECSTGQDDCDRYNGTCENTNGSFKCSCNEGYDGDGVKCFDINECLNGDHNCSANAYCKNLNGSYSCQCKNGFIGDGITCLDINECLPEFEEFRRNESKCVENSVCVNTIGSYKCECALGYQGNGTLCEDIDECLEVHCNANADCRNVNGSFTCSCRSGWTGNGYQCSDIDECKIDPDICKNGNCSNQNGYYLCQCHPGYRQNGLVCELDNLPKQAAQKGDCEVDSKSFKCLCHNPEKRERNIMCNGLFVALLILVIVAIIVLIFVVKYLKSRKLRKIQPIRSQRDKYIEIQNVSEVTLV